MTRQLRDVFGVGGRRGVVMVVEGGVRREELSFARFQL